MTDRSQWRGDRRIRVVLRLDGQSTQPTGMWVVDGPAVQRASLAGPYIALVDVAGQVALLQSLGDPFLTRAIQRPERVGHALTRLPRTTVHVDVPLPEKGPMPEISIRIADLTEVVERPGDWQSLAELLESPPPTVHWLSSVGLSALAEHPDWRGVETGTGRGAEPEHA